MKNNSKKNEKKMAFLKKEAMSHPENWVVDPIDVYKYKESKDDPLYKEKVEAFQLILDSIDWYKPSKNRVWAYDLEDDSGFIYLDRELFLDCMRPYWAEKKYLARHKTVSLDELNEKYELDVDSLGNLTTTDVYYTNNTEPFEILDIAVESALAEMTPQYRTIFAMRMNQYTTREIAKELGISQPAVIKKIKILKKRLNGLSRPI